MISTPLGRSAAIYGVAFAVAAGAQFLLLLILTRYLTPTQFGEVTAFLMSSALLANVAALGAPGVVSVRYFKTPAEHFRDLVGTSLVAVCAAHAVAAIAIAALYPWIAQELQLSVGFTLLTALASLCLSLNMIVLVLFQSASQPSLYLRSRIVQAAGEVLLCLALLWLCDANAGARVYSYTAALAASAAWGLHVCRQRGMIGAGISRAHLRDLWRVGIPLLPHIVAGSALTYLDRLVVTTALGVESLGLYMAAMQIGMLMIGLVEPLHRALAPWLFQQLAKDDPAVKQLIVKRTYQLYGALALLGLVVAAVGYAAFTTLVDPRYAAARPLVGWMVLGFVFQGMYYTVVGYLMFAEKTARLSLVTASTVAVGSLISYLLTSALGIQGAALSFVLKNGLLFALVWFAAARTVPMPWLPGSR